MEGMRRWGRSLFLGAALSFAAVRASAGDVQSAERDQRAGAQKTFEAGSKLYDTRHYEDALAAFRASYQIVASPNSRLMVARCLRDLGRNVEAYREYDAVAAEASRSGERYKSTGAAATEERDELRPKVALLTVRVADAPPAFTVKVGQATLAAGEIGAAVPFDAGPLVVTAEAPDGATARAEVTLTAGAASEVELRLAKKVEAPVAAPPPPAPVAPPPAPSSSTPLRTWAYVAGGVGGAGLITFAIFGAMTSSKYSSLESACPDKQCPPDKQGDIDAGKTYQTVANVGLGVGLVGIAAGATLFVLSLNQPKDESAPKVGLGLGTATVSGRF
jgi:hypothetical protein